MLKKLISSLLFFSTLMVCLPIQAGSTLPKEKDIILRLYSPEIRDRWSAINTIVTHSNVYSKSIRVEALEVAFNLIDELQQEEGKSKSGVRPENILQFLVKWIPNEEATIEAVIKYLSNHKNEDLFWLFDGLSWIKKLPKDTLIVDELIEAIHPFLTSVNSNRQSVFQALFNIVTLVDVRQLPHFEELAGAVHLDLDNTNPLIATASAGVVLRAGFEIEKAWRIVQWALENSRQFFIVDDGIDISRPHSPRAIAVMAAQHACLKAKLHMPPRVFLAVKAAEAVDLCRRALNTMHR